MAPTDRFDPGSPFTLADLRHAMQAQHADATTYLAAIPPDEFVRAQGDRWSPAEHVRHLAKSAFAIATGTALPRVVLWLRFGRPPACSRDFLKLRDDYRARLAAGGRAGRFAPTPEALPADLAGYQRGVIATWGAANAKVHAAMLGWTESSVEQAAIVHPLIGPLTVREMLFFQHYHEAHHLNLVAMRRGAGAS